MIERLRAFWRGRVTFRGWGEHLASFLNEAARDGIVFFHTQRSDKGLKAQVRMEDFRRLKRSARNSHTRIRITAKYGRPFLVARLLRRKGLMAGMAMMIAVLAVLSQMILFISVSGNQQIRSQTILEQAAQLGLKTWIWQRNVNLNQIAEVLTQQVQDAAWIGIKREGTHVNIQVVEKVKAQVSVEAGNLVATKTGVVQDILVIQGNARIHEGELVRAGQVLIAKDSDKAAKGFVRGRAWYSSEAVVPLAEDVMEESGQVAKGWGIKFGSRVIMVTTQQSPFPQAWQEVRSYSLPSWRNWQIPVELINVEYHEILAVHKERSVEEARRLAEEQAKAEVMAQLTPEAAIAGETVKVLPGMPGTERVRVEAETYEELAAYEKKQAGA